MSDPSYYNSPQNSIPGPLSGQYYRFAPTYIRGRNPVNTLDLKPKENQGFYPVGSFWVNSSSPPEIWVLASINSNAGVLTANWVLVANSTITGPLLTLSDNNNVVVSPSPDTANPPGNIHFIAGAGVSIVAGTNSLTITNTAGAAETIKGDDGVAVGPDGGGSINVVGTIVANATNAKALYLKNTSANTETWQLQLSAAIASTDVTKVGVSAFSSAQFAVDANGFVTLIGGTTAPVLGIVPDAHTGPGTTPVIPNGSGNIILEGGATFATGTQAHPIRTNSLAANTIDLEIQLAGSNAATSTANDFGVSQFDANQFTVTSGYVQIIGGGTTGAVTGLTGDDSLNVVPTTGVISLTGSTVANATHTKPVYFVKAATSVEELDVQLTTTSTSGAKNINKSGLAHFDSAAFTVDAGTGFVGLIGGSNPAIQTITGDAGGAIGPTGTPENIGLSGAVTTYVTGATNNLKVEVVSALNTFLVGAGATSHATTLGPLTNGQLIIGSTASAPVAATLTAGPGINIANAAGAITISSTVSTVTWTDIAASQTLAPSSGYVCVSPGGALVLTLPATAAQGTIIEIVLDGATSWTIAQNAGQQIRVGNSQTTAGTGGSVSSTSQGNAIRLVCSVANLRWVTLSTEGTLTVV